MFSTGQSCVASKRIIVVGRDRGEKFLAEFTAAMQDQEAGDPMDPDTVLGPLSSQRALDLLLNQVSAAVEAGARVITGGSRIDRGGFYIEPTVLTDIDPANPAYDTEFFGPVASVYIVDSEDEAIKLANATRFGLGASVFTGNLERGRAIAAQIDSGMVFVNQPAWTAPEVPFGGTKSSGFGRELSELGFGEFVNHKLVNVAPQVRHPGDQLSNNHHRHRNVSDGGEYIADPALPR
jgi:succinate-semialdehyde dehydrogenase / glutarate-semialdehyde dehydrogenase